MSRVPTYAYVASLGRDVPGSARIRRQEALRRHPQRLQFAGRHPDRMPTAVVRTKGTCLSARYHRMKSRRGHAKATVATGHNYFRVS